MRITAGSISLRNIYSEANKMHRLILLSYLSFISYVVLADVNTFYGSQKMSYAKYGLWNGTGTLKFKFKTREPNGILFYIDDHPKPRGNGNFIKLKVTVQSVELHLQVSYMIGGKIIIFVSSSLDNTCVIDVL